MFGIRSSVSISGKGTPGKPTHRTVRNIRAATRGRLRTIARKRLVLGVEALERRELLAGDLAAAQQLLDSQMQLLGQQEATARSDRDAAISAADQMPQTDTTGGTAYNAIEAPAWTGYQTQLTQENNDFQSADVAAKATYQGVVGASESTHSDAV